jgi:hypothetical protein
LFHVLVCRLHAHRHKGDTASTGDAVDKLTSKVLLSSNPGLSLPQTTTVVPPAPYLAMSRGRLILQTQELLNLERETESELGDDAIQALHGVTFTSLEHAFDLAHRQLEVHTKSSVSTHAVYQSLINQFLDKISIASNEEVSVVTAVNLLH